jgi:DNA-binding transcriptional MerR regulator
LRRRRRRRRVFKNSDEPEVSAVYVLADRGVPTVEIQKMLRHKHLTTTEIYVTSLQGNTERAAAVLSEEFSELQPKVTTHENVGLKKSG